jgi:antitoxin component of MazEF toxin-antitoxin module
MLRTKATVSMWGNSQALRIPIEISRNLGIRVNDEVVLEVRENVLTVSKPEVPQEGTIEYLFKDYSGETFQTELINPDVPVGNEKW